MGLTNSPASFQRCMDAVLVETKWKHNIGYFDDVVDYSKTFVEHVAHCARTLGLLREAGFTIHPKKVQLCRRRLKYLGYIISPGKCFPDPDKVKKIKDYPPPRDEKGIMRFLGLLGYYRKFIPRFSEKTKPLFKLLKANVKWEWSEEWKVSFEFLRDALCGSVELYLPDMNVGFIITCDASRKGLAAILSQEKDGLRYPIWFASRTRTLRQAETRYSVSEIELLAVLFGVMKFQHYIELTNFTIETDHSALQWLKKLKEPTGRLAKWFMILQEFDFTVKYRPGTSGCIKTADALSRIEECLVVEMEVPLDRDLINHEQDKMSYSVILKNLYEART